MKNNLNKSFTINDDLLINKINESKKIEYIEDSVFKKYLKGIDRSVHSFSEKSETLNLSNEQISESIDVFFDYYNKKKILSLNARGSMTYHDVARYIKNIVNNGVILNSSNQYKIIKSVINNVVDNSQKPIEKYKNEGIDKCLKEIFQIGHYNNYSNLVKFYKDSKYNIVNNLYDNLVINNSGKIKISEYRKIYNKDLIKNNENILNNNIDNFIEIINNYIQENNSLDKIDLGSHLKCNLLILNLLNNDEKKFIKFYYKNVNSLINESVVKELKLSENPKILEFIENEKIRVIKEDFIKNNTDDFFNDYDNLNPRIVSSIFSQYNDIFNENTSYSLFLNITNFNNDFSKNYILNNYKGLIKYYLKQYKKSKNNFIDKLSLIKDKDFTLKFLEIIKDENKGFEKVIYLKLFKNNLSKEDLNKIETEILNKAFNEKGNLGQIYDIIREYSIPSDGLDILEKGNNYNISNLKLENIQDLLDYKRKKAEYHHYNMPKKLDSNNVEKIKLLIKDKDDLKILLDNFELSFIVKNKILDDEKLKKILETDESFDMFSEIFNSDLDLEFKGNIFDFYVNSGLLSKFLFKISDIKSKEGDFNKRSNLPTGYIDKEFNRINNYLLEYRISFKEYIIIVQSLKSSFKQNFLNGMKKNEEIIVNHILKSSNIEINKKDFNNASKFIKHALNGKRITLKLDLLDSLSDNRELLKFLLNNVYLNHIGYELSDNTELGLINSSNNLHILLYIENKCKDLYSEDDLVSISKYIKRLEIKEISDKFIGYSKKFNLKINKYFLLKFITPYYGKEYSSSIFYEESILDLKNDHELLLDNFNYRYNDLIKNGYFNFLITNTSKYISKLDSDDYKQKILKANGISTFKELFIDQLGTGIKYNDKFINYFINGLKYYSKEIIEKINNKNINDSYSISNRMILNNEDFNKINDFCKRQGVEKIRDLVLLKEGFGVDDLEKYIKELDGLDRVSREYFLNTAISHYYINREQEIKHHNYNYKDLLDNKSKSITLKNINLLSRISFNRMFEFFIKDEKNNHSHSTGFINDLYKEDPFKIVLYMVKYIYPRDSSESNINRKKFYDNININDKTELVNNIGKFQEYGHRTIDLFLNLKDNFENLYYGNFLNKNEKNNIINNILGDVNLIGTDFFKNKFYNLVLKSINKQYIKSDIRSINKELNDIFKNLL